MKKISTLVDPPLAYPHRPTPPAPYPQNVDKKTCFLTSPLEDENLILSSK